MRGRLETAPDPVVRRLLIDPGITKDLCHFDYYLDINTAHVVMLAENGILDEDTAARVLYATDDMRRAGPGALEIDESLEDLFFNIEANLMARAGPETGGRLHTARSRNDMRATASRMRMRAELTEVCARLLSLRRTLVRLASDHVDTVTSGYTHLQAAEPITIGHYLSAVLHALERDYSRLERAMAETNASPLGSGAMASTTFDIDRSRTAELLGFDAVLENSLDGVASRDYVPAALGALAILTNNISRFAQDLHVWATGEFNHVELDASISTSSSIMPQKKNPVTLEHLKAKAAHLQATWISSLSALKSATYSNSREAGVESVRFAWDGVTEARTAVELFEHTLTKLTFNTELLRNRAVDNFSCVTELANGLVREHHLPFRTAHHVVGRLVADCLSAGKTASDIDRDMVATASEGLVDQPLQVSSELISQTLNPVSNVAARSAVGGPAPEEVRRQLGRLGEVLHDDEVALDRTTTRQRETTSSLRSYSRRLAGQEV